MIPRPTLNFNLVLLDSQWKVPYVPATQIIADNRKRSRPDADDVDHETHEDDNVDSDKKDEPEQWNAKPMDSKEREKYRLGPVPKGGKCWGCVNLDEDDKTTIQSDAIVALRNMAKSAFARKDWVELAEGMAEHYRVEIMEATNKRLLPGIYYNHT